MYIYVYYSQERICANIAFAIANNWLSVLFTFLPILRFLKNSITHEYDEEKVFTNTLISAKMLPFNMKNLY